ncbi:conserved hypothetical protein [Ricinus communis]|uniref:Uncharacterized protein n=1 Tax=Ricinus communis TaxID=3988 RepID=B9TCJ0_RICCO|nr:conserved hypothetical protein [Ricinus communis]
MPAHQTIHSRLVMCHIAVSCAGRGAGETVGAGAGRRTAAGADLRAQGQTVASPRRQVPREWRRDRPWRRS